MSRIRVLGTLAEAHEGKNRCSGQRGADMRDDSLVPYGFYICPALVLFLEVKAKVC